mmetsp:Transcript_113381/g.316766  ORF Transcript_113381/g.316766 Transcript_113381/m.316766 type:complete len:231 (-) Transcript_113381:3042-3734(-)
MNAHKHKESPPPHKMSSARAPTQRGCADNEGVPGHTSVGVFVAGRTRRTVAAHGIAVAVRGGGGRSPARSSPAAPAGTSAAPRRLGSGLRLRLWLLLDGLDGPAELLVAIGGPELLHLLVVLLLQRRRSVLVDLLVLRRQPPPQFRQLLRDVAHLRGAQLFCNGLPPVPDEEEVGALRPLRLFRCRLAAQELVSRPLLLAPLLKRALQPQVLLAFWRLLKLLELDLVLAL